MIDRGWDQDLVPAASLARTVRSRYPGMGECDATGVGATIGPMLGLGLGDGFCATKCADIDGLLLGPMLGAPLGGACPTCADEEGLLLGIGMTLAIGLGGAWTLCAASPVRGPIAARRAAASVTAPTLPKTFR